MHTHTSVRIELKAPMTAKEIRSPSYDDDMNDVVITKVYSGGTRLDNGWRYRWDGVHRLIPRIIPRKNKGRRLQTVTVVLGDDRMTVETIFAYYTGGNCVEYGFFVKE